MSYGFTRLVCINPPTKKEIQDWNPDLDEEAVSILLQLLNAEYIQDQIVPDYDRCMVDPSAVYTAWGVDSLLHSIVKMNPGLCFFPPKRGLLDNLWAIVGFTGKRVIVICCDKNIYNIELTTEAELIEKMKGI